MFRTITPEKTAEIQGKLLAGMKPLDVATEMGVSYSSVSRAKAKIPADVLEKMDEEQQSVISDLVMMQIEAGIESTITIARQVDNENWRNQQNAAQLATFYGVISDKSIRLLEASENANRAAIRATTPEQTDYTN